jgi:hypothetical protein
MNAVNYWAVLVSAVASMVVGFLVYGPLFGKQFMSAMGMDKMSPDQQAAMRKSAGLKYFYQFLASLVMFYVLAGLIVWNFPTEGAKGGLIMAFWVWIGFIVPLKFGDSLWGGKMTLFWIGIFNMLVTLLVGGAIIGAWH